jgi:hypothetical protein
MPQSDIPIAVTQHEALAAVPLPLWFLQNPLTKGLSHGRGVKIVIPLGLRAKSSFERTYDPKTEQERQMALLFPMVLFYRASQ